MDSYIQEEVPVPEGDEAKALHKKKLVMEKRIIADSIKDHLIPQVSSLKTLKAMFDALTKLFEGKNINRKMTLRNQLKNVKIQNEETIQSYFKRVSQIKEQLEAVRAMLQDQDIHMHIWTKASRTMVYVQNRTPHRVLENKTPEEVFSARNQKSPISEYLVVLCTSTFQNRRGLN